MYVICGKVRAHDPKMCPFVFGSDVMHINEEAGLNVKILKCSYLGMLSKLTAVIVHGKGLTLFHLPL